MIFGHDTAYSLGTAVELVNSPLPDLAALHALVEVRKVSEVGAMTEHDLAAVREVRDAFHEVFLASSLTAATARLNSVLAGARVTPRLTDHDGYELHVHYFAPGASVAEHLAADCGVALAHVLALGEHERLRVCSAPDCEHVFVDESRNRSRVYCDSRTCGNRLHVAAYRARRRAL